ncbi:MAG: membrane associated rhomboid family serine protease [Gammaproteobacteria bacterium]|jgi:membrane associated rhomboid family serine protease
MLMNIVSYSTSDQAAREQNLRIAFYWAVSFAVGLWLIKVVEVAFGLDFGRFGVSPGQLDGLDGILFAPLIHGSWSHLASNTPPIIVLGTALLYGYPRAAKIALPVLYLGTEIGVWLFARETSHYGASGLSFGMMFFVFTIGALRWDRQAIALSMIVFFLYGSMIWGLFPHDPTISFETHLSGACLGVLLAVYSRKLDPTPVEKRYSWEDEETENDDDISWHEQ